MYSEPSQKSKMKPFFSFEKLAQISGNCFKFPKERIKTSVAIGMFKTENHCKTPQVVDATDGTRHTRKLRTEDPKEDAITESPKEDPITKDPKENRVTEYPKKHPITEDPKRTQSKTDTTM